MLEYTTAHQPAFLPWIGFLQKILFAKKFIIMDLAQFRKRSFMHRNLIEINGVQNFIGLKIPKKMDEKITSEIEIPNEVYLDNINEIYKKVYFQYKKEPYFYEVEEIFDNLKNIKNTKFNEIIYKHLSFIIEKFESKVQIYLETQILNKNNYSKLNANQKLVLHAQILTSKNYLTGTNSKEYLDIKQFEKFKIKNFIQNFNYVQYLKFQKTSKPLSFIHIMSKIGSKNLKEKLLQSISSDINEF